MSHADRHLMFATALVEQLDVYGADIQMTETPQGRHLQITVADDVIAEGLTRLLSDVERYDLFCAAVEARDALRRARG